MASDRLELNPDSTGCLLGTTGQVALSKTHSLLSNGDQNGLTDTCYENCLPSDRVQAWHTESAHHITDHNTNSHQIIVLIFLLCRRKLRLRVAMRTSVLGTPSWTPQTHPHSTSCGLDPLLPQDHATHLLRGPSSFPPHILLAESLQDVDPAH